MFSIIRDKIKLQGSETMPIAKDKCPKCGSTDNILNKKSGKLRCKNCRHEHNLIKAQTNKLDTKKLKGQIITCGAKNIIADSSEVITFKCSSCAAEVAIDTNEALHAKCHWCRHTFTVKEKIPNGSVPDMILPFKVSKEVAKNHIEKFVNQRTFFAHPKFKENFCLENIVPVYLPYMLVDINAKVRLIGLGERSFFKSLPFLFKPRRYDILRDFTLVVDGLTIEAASSKMMKRRNNTNVINAIMPFDTENAVKWNANYLKGFISEKRDTNVQELTELVNTQAKDIARHNANQVIKKYNRGVNWHFENLNAQGKRWQTAYLPVWLYSYQSGKGRRKKLHYVVVNGRTEKTSGNIPLNIIKLLIYSIVIQIIALISIFIITDLFIEDDFIAGLITLPFFLAGFIFFNIAYFIYRNMCARHRHEANTKALLTNITGKDFYLGQVEREGFFRMKAANNLKVSNMKSSRKAIKRRVIWLIIIILIILVIIGYIMGNPYY